MWVDDGFVDIEKYRGTDLSDGLNVERGRYRESPEIHNGCLVIYIIVSIYLVLWKLVYSC